MKLLIGLFCCFMSFDHAYLNNKSIAGTWILADKAAVNYSEIVLSDKASALFKSKGDTLYWYQYRLKADSIIELVDVQGVEYTSKITKLSEDSLIFDGLIHQQGIQRYFRKRE